MSMLGEVAYMRCAKESYQRRCVMLVWKTGVLKAMSGEALAWSTLWSPSEPHVGGGTQGHALPFAKVFLGSLAFLWSFIHPHLSFVHVKRDKKGLNVVVVLWGGHISTASVAPPPSVQPVSALSIAIFFRVSTVQLEAPSHCLSTEASHSNRSYL